MPVFSCSRELNSLLQISAVEGKCKLCSESDFLVITSIYSDFGPLKAKSDYLHFASNIWGQVSSIFNPWHTRWSRFAWRNAWIVFPTTDKTRAVVALVAGPQLHCAIRTGSQIRKCYRSMWYCLDGSHAPTICVEHTAATWQCCMIVATSSVNPMKLIAGRVMIGWGNCLIWIPPRP